MNTVRNPQKFSGTWTALVTPFTETEAIDWNAFATLIEAQIAAGVTGILFNGTTGESPTIDAEEFAQMITVAKKQINGRCLLMVGTGTNSTHKSILLSQQAQSLGADVLLLVNPYYNKPTQHGLYLHFRAIADAVQLPVFLYNIKGRTSINLETSTLQKLVDTVPNIVGVKEASGDLVQIENVCTVMPADFTVLSGDDNITVRIMRDFGARGVISVVSNMVPERIVKMVTAALQKDFVTAEEMDRLLQPLFAGAFIETNPIPVKAALALAGKIKEVYRLPLCSMLPENKEKWRTILSQNAVLL